MVECVRFMVQSKMDSLQTAFYHDKVDIIVPQISANNSTLLRYSKKLGIRLLFGYEYQAQSGVITRLEAFGDKKVITRFSIRVCDDIRANSNRAGNRASTEHDFGISISSFDST